MQFFSPLTVIVGHNGSGKTVSSAVSSSLLREPKVGFSTRQGGDVRKSKRYHQTRKHREAGWGKQEVMESNYRELDLSLSW